MTNSQQLQQALADNFNAIQRLEQQDNLNPTEFKRLNDLKQQRMKLQSNKSFNGSSTKTKPSWINSKTVNN